jgi:hypothetical protein
MRKLFLVAERLTWEEGLVSMHDKDLNEELNWKFNYELGILDPFVEDPEQVPGGKNSQNNRFYPYQNEHEMKLAFKLMFMTENLTEVSWSLWIGVQLDIEKMLNGCNKTEAAPSQSTSGGAKGDHTCLVKPEANMTDITVSPDRASDLVGKPPGLPTPPSSSEKGSASGKNITRTSTPIVFPVCVSTAPMTDADLTTESRTSLSYSKRIVSYRTLQDFYTLLDKIERTSYVGALYLEAYAEKLRDDMCKDCWFNHNVKLDIF